MAKNVHMSKEYLAKQAKQVKQPAVQKDEPNIPLASSIGQPPNNVGGKAFSEVGTAGLNRWGGQVFQEFLPKLRWPQAGRVYQEMAGNDPVIGAVIYVCEQLIRKATWRVETTGTTNVDQEAANFVKTCMHDMSAPWIDIITEILTMLTFGWAWHEEVYKRREGDVRDPKRRSKYDDGRIGWRKLPGRAQHTMAGWVFDEQGDGDVIALEQQAPGDTQAIRIVPLNKSLLFRTKIEYNNPEGRSLLRNAYRPWYFKKNIEEIEGIGLERDLAGLPVLQTPEGLDIWNTEDEHARGTKTHAETLVRNIRRDENEGIVLPFGWELSLLSTGGRRQFDTNSIINRYDQRIAMVLLADIVMMGADKVGSFALAEVKQSLLGAALEATLDSITEIFNRYAIPNLIKLNAFPGLTALPTLVHGEVHTPNLTEIARFIQAVSGADMPLFPDDNLEAYLRSLAGMPERTTEVREEQERIKEEEERKREEQAERMQEHQDALNDDSGGDPGGNGKPDGRALNAPVPLSDQT